MINIVKLQDKVRELANKYPNAVYKNSDNCGCYYGVGEVENGPLEPGCLIGQAVRRLDPEVFEHISENGDDVVSMMAKQSKYFDNSTDDGQIENWLSIVQGQQDDSKTWSQAVKAADDNPIENEEESEMFV